MDRLDRPKRKVRRAAGTTAQRGAGAVAHTEPAIPPAEDDREGAAELRDALLEFADGRVRAGDVTHYAEHRLERRTKRYG